MVGTPNQGFTGPSGKTIAGIGMIAVVIAALIAIFVVVERGHEATALLDPTTYCPRSGPVAVHAVLIDRTDALSDIQLEALRKDLLHWALDVPKYGAFRVYEVGVGGSLLSPVVNVCNPGDGSDASSLNANPAFLKRRYREKFLAPLDAMIAGMRADEKQATSPIMEAVQAISVRDFGETGPQGDNGLIIVSDLLQHGPTVSLYRGVPKASDFVKSPAGRSLHADLSGVAVSIYLINRVKDAKYQTDALGAFWIQWLTAQGAEVGAFKQFPG